MNIIGAKIILKGRKSIFKFLKLWSLRQGVLFHCWKGNKEIDTANKCTITFFVLYRGSISSGFVRILQLAN